MVHPFAFVIVTVYVPADVTDRHCVVAPVFHEYETAPAVAHKFAKPPVQKEAPGLVENSPNEATYRVAQKKGGGAEA